MNKIRQLLKNITWLMSKDIKQIDLTDREFKFPEPSLEDMIKCHNEFWERHKWFLDKK